MEESKKLPHEASEFLAKQFPEGIQLGELRTTKDEAGHTVYIVHAGDSTNSYIFRFTEEGKLISQDIRPAYADGQDAPQEEFHEGDI